MTTNVVACKCPKDVIVNTVGCGDAMVAGMLDSLLRGWTAEAALKRMIAAASANMHGKSTFFSISRPLLASEQ